MLTRDKNLNRAKRLLICQNMKNIGIQPTKGYSGTAIFSKIKPLSVINGFADAIAEKYNLVGDSYGDPTKEGRQLALNLKNFGS